LSHTRPSRYPSRGTSDKKTLHQIVDEGLFCTIAFIRDGVPCQIPTGFCRVGNAIYIHASAKSDFINSIAGKQVSFSITHLDALVLSPTAFDHSFNYRSVIGVAEAIVITDPKEKRKFFNLFTDRYIPGRISDVGEPTDDQVTITKIVRLSLGNAAAKVREGDAGLNLREDEPWCGIIPVKSEYGEPQKDPQVQASLPDYIKKLIDGVNKS